MTNLCVHDVIILDHVHLHELLQVSNHLLAVEDPLDVLLRGHVVSV